MPITLENLLETAAVNDEYRTRISTALLDLEKSGEARIGTHLLDVGINPKKILSSVIVQAPIADDGKAELSAALAEYEQLGRVLASDTEFLLKRVQGFAKLSVWLVVLAASPVLYSAFLADYSGEYGVQVGVSAVYLAGTVLLATVHLYAADALLKAHGYHIKRRWRVAFSRSIIRGQLTSRFGLPSTLMPVCRHQGAGRSDPELSGFEKTVPFMMLLLLVFDVVMLIAVLFLGLRGFSIGQVPADRAGIGLGEGALFTICMLVGAWAFVLIIPLVRRACERHKVHLLEGASATIDRPFPFVDLPSLPRIRSAKGFREDRGAWSLQFAAVLIVPVALVAFTAYCFARPLGPSSAKASLLVFVALVSIQSVLNVSISGRRVKKAIVHPGGVAVDLGALRAGGVRSD